jgi:hypothetical protein
MLILSSYYLVICNCHFMVSYWNMISVIHGSVTSFVYMEFELSLAATMVCTSCTSFLTALS